mgnify:CR=1 FL=1|tara:strand:+ start:1288 stop:3402 length:2115 start_codon:yes stop_codon:yes gene_type:complete
MAEWTNKKKQIINENAETNNFTSEKKQSKFESILETGENYVQDAGRLAKEAGSSALATIPSLPESLLNVLNMAKNYGGKKLGLYPQDKKSQYIDIPYAPSFSEAKAAIQSPTQGAAFSGTESQLSQGKQNEIKMGLLEQGIFPNSPEWKDKYYNAVYDALGMATNEYETGVGEFLKTPAEWFGMGVPFGKTASRISGFAGGVNEALNRFGMDESHALFTSLGLDVGLTVLAGVRNPSIVNKFNDSVKYAIQKGKIKDAKELVEFAKNNNIPLLGMEALAQATGDPSLIKLVKLVAQSESGKKYFLGLNNRQLVLSEKSEKFVNDFFGAGNIRYLDVTNNTIKNIKEVRKNLKKRINVIARKKGYKDFDASLFGTEATTVVYDQLIHLSKNKSITLDKSKAISNAAKQIEGKDQMALQDLSQQLYKDIDQYKNVIGKQDEKLAGFLLEVKGYVDASLKNIDGYTEGNKIYENLRAKIIAPLDNATSGLNINKEATMGLLEKVLLGKQDYVSINRLSRELNKIDNKLFPEMAQSLLSEMLGNIKIAENMGGNIFKTFYGTSNKQKQVKAVLTGVANAQGKDPAKVIKGFERFLQTMNATSKYSGGESITTQGLKMEQGMGSKLAKINVTAPLEIFDNIVANSNWDKLGQILTAPNSIELMVQLANSPAALRNWKLLVAPMFVGGNKMEDKEATQKKYENQSKGITQ